MGTQARALALEQESVLALALEQGLALGQGLEQGLALVLVPAYRARQSVG